MGRTGGPQGDAEVAGQQVTVGEQQVGGYKTDGGCKSRTSGESTAVWFVDLRVHLLFIVINIIIIFLQST